MYKRTNYFNELMDEYDIANLSHGAKEDKLGDVIEDYCVKIYSSKELLAKIKKHSYDLQNADEYIFITTLEKIGVDVSSINSIQATRDIQPRITGGNPKTDVIIDILLSNNEVKQIPISVKSSTVAKVAMAEFDVDTIVREMGITDKILIDLLNKHQKDASAKNFSSDEKLALTQHLEPYKKKFVQWVLTGTSCKNSDLRYPLLMVKFDLTKQDEITDINVYSIDEYVDSVMLDKNGNPKAGGFGTGLGWTYATGSKGKKIQFKG